MNSPKNPYSSLAISNLEVQPKPNNPTLQTTGSITAVTKFQINSKAVNTPNNEVLSRTFGKVAVVDRAWATSMQGHSDMPLANELWLTYIVRDTAPGTNKGCLVLHPRHKLDPSEVSRLVSGMYDTDFENGILYIRPKHQGPYWILPLTLRDSLIKKTPNVHSTVVSL